MNLESVTAELRPRGAWEAADLGARMVRRDAGVIYKTWFSVTLPLLLLAALGVMYLPYPGLVMLLYWWCEPLVDGPILHIISRRLFGDATDARTAVRQVPTLARRNWIFLLTPWRLHFARSLAIPVTQLEGLSGTRRRERAKVLNRVTMNHGIGLTTAYQHLALSLYLGVILVGFMLIPAGYEATLGMDWLATFFDAQPGDKGARLAGLLTFYIAQSALHPWFVGCGFGLYIDCRTKLEAWDIEVAFRRMLQRRHGRPGAIAAILVCALLGWSESGRAEAQDIEPFWDRAAIEAARASVYADERLQQYETVEEWQRIDADDEPGQPDANAETWLRGLGRIAGLITEFGLWLGVAFILILLFATRASWLPYLRHTPMERRAPRRVILDSGEITADQLPNDIPAAVRTLWADGQRREALSLLYRGSVFLAVDRLGVRVPRSATEGECVEAFSVQLGTPLVDYFRNVVAAWVWCAYAGRAPTDDVVERLCNDWRKFYEVPA